MKQITSCAESNTDQARKCLALIRDIAGRGAVSVDPQHVGYAIQELTQILLERTGTEEIYFLPVSPAELTDLDKLREELDFADACSQDLAWKDAQGESLPA
jgi:hypothetical protein